MYIIRDHFIILVSGCLIGLAALLLVYMLPTEPMKNHVYWSLDMIEKEFTDEVLIEGYRATLTGNFTDCLMLEHAVYSSESHSLLEQVLHMYRAESYYNENDPDGWWPGQSLMDYLQGLPQPQEVTYSRYWHGYLLILKPLLLLTSVNTIRLFNAALQLIVAGFVVIAFCRKKAYTLAKAFLVSVPFMFFVSTYASLSLSICFYIMNVVLLVMLNKEEMISTRGLYAHFFLIIGMLTSYFDFLTYPLVTLGYPLCVYLYFHGDTFRKNIKRLCILSVEWFVGYIGMWAAKWVLADLLTGSTIIKDAVDTIVIRTQSAENASRIGGFFTVIVKNLQVYGNWCYVLLGILCILILLTSVRRREISNIIGRLQKGICFFLIALYPLAWYFVLQNHSEQHWQFTCRIVSITVFAGMSGAMQLVCKEEG